MNKKSKVKFDAPTTIFGNYGVPFSRPFSGVFRYQNGQICWPVTDFFADKQRSSLAHTSIESYIAPLRDIVDFMSSLKPSDECYQFTDASDAMFLKLRQWLQSTTTLRNNQINRRLKHLVELLFYIQDEYNAETTSGGALIRTKGDDIPIYGVEVTRKKDHRGNEYFHHTSFLRDGQYTQRSPVTSRAINEVSTIIENHAKINSKQALYNSEVLRLSTDILEATGIRSGELVHMGQAALELIQKQLDNDNQTLGELIDSPNSILKKYFSKSEIKEILDVITTYMDEDREIIWLLIITNKSTVNAGQPRLLPIVRSLAEDIVDFYEDFVLNMIDLDTEERLKTNRSSCGYIIPKFDGKPFFNHVRIDIDENEDTDGDGKAFSAFYSNKVGQLSTEKVSPHLYRHRFITNIVVKMMEKAGSSDKDSMIVILQRVARITGHANPQSLWPYIEKGKVILQNRKLVKKKQVTNQVELLLKAHGYEPDSPLVKEIIQLIS
ncbi:site-specific integrase [Vibrio parahaemolyticus]|uniref:site-specific integrase n=1 Tax=Vibrio parahaemolyticus TaxID=670 RepID=UPI000472FB9D|nr:site-specific integrase [Vibrio parahaemolyticus]